MAPAPLAARQEAAPELGAGGALSCDQGVVRVIELDRRPVFDPESTDLAPLSWTYRALNALHVRTSPSFLRRELLFEEGDCYDDFLVAESARLLDAYGFLASARITARDDASNGKSVRVETQDEWSTKVDVGVTYDDALNLEKFEVTEENFLGQGVFAEFTHRERRETRAQSVSLATPRLFGRSDASIEWGRDRPGQFFNQFVRYPFLGEAGRYSVRQGYNRGTTYFSYSTDQSAAYSQVLVPAFRDLLEFSFARRFGEPGRSWITGLTLTRDVIRFPGQAEVAYGIDFDGLEPYPGELPVSVQRQLRSSGATRLSLHLGTRRYRYEEYVGVDGLRDRMLVSLGLYGGLSVGRGLPWLTPSDVPALDDWSGRLHGSFGAPVGSSLLHGGVTVEARRDAGMWEDVLMDADLVAWLRSGALPAHTVFLRASVAGGSRVSLPFQLSLGGREGVRSLPEDRFPGGRLARFVVEDRIVFPWPRSGTADLGLTLFADVGRVWPGDVPYAVDSGWQAGVGAGLRIGLPSRTRNVWRMDVAVPAGPSAGAGGPVFRVTFELNRLRNGFLTRDVLRSRRYNLGAEHF
jgi:hypothetical protein